MTWHPNIYNYQVHHSGHAKTTSIMLPPAHWNTIKELCTIYDINRSELIRRLIENIAAGYIPHEILQSKVYPITGDKESQDPSPSQNPPQE